jgi:Tol biopolymer transport system component
LFATLTATAANTPTSVPSLVPDPSCPEIKIDPPPTSRFDPIQGSNVIAYSGDGLSLVSVNTGKTAALHSLSELDLTGVDWNFAWSPDATYIAFVYGDSRPAPCGVGYLMLADLSQGEVRPLLRSLQRYSQPTWSPDSQWLALTDDSGRLTVIHVRNGEVMILSDRAEPLHTPAWSDAEHVVYVQRGTLPGLGDLVSQPADESTPQTLLSDVYIYEFALSPDGRYVAYSGGLSVLADLQSGNKQDIGTKLTERLQWSPDGQYLLGRGGEAGIYVVRPKGSMDVTQMDFYGVPGPQQSWSPDSHAFAVLVGNGELPSIGIYHMDTQTLEKLPISVRSPWALAWSTR